MKDYGFSDEEEFFPKNESLKKLEDLILPLIDNLIDTADKPVIKWENREKPLRELREKILKITRG